MEREADVVEREPLAERRDVERDAVADRRHETTAWRASRSKRIQAKLISIVGYRLVALLGSTFRWKSDGADHYDRVVRSGRQPIMAFWHGRILSATYYFRRRGIVVITSENFDGEWIAGIIERFGYGTARGSTSRGARRALLQLTRDMAAGRPAAFTVTDRAAPRASRSPAPCGWRRRPVIQWCPFTSRPIAAGR